ncbi:unnamed protein product [Discosporangium mesarthrocarpum]
MGRREGREEGGWPGGWLVACCHWWPFFDSVPGVGGTVELQSSAVLVFLLQATCLTRGTKYLVFLGLGFLFCLCSEEIDGAVRKRSSILCSDANHSCPPPHPLFASYPLCSFEPAGEPAIPVCILHRNPFVLTHNPFLSLAVHLSRSALCRLSSSWERFSSSKPQP